LAIIWYALRRQTAATQAALAAAGAPAAGAPGAGAAGAGTAKLKQEPPKPRASKTRSGKPRRTRGHFVSNPGYVFWLFALWYSILRSVIEEPFRDNPLPWQVYLDEAAG